MNFTDLSIADQNHVIATEGLFNFFKKKNKSTADAHTDSFGTTAAIATPTTTQYADGLAFYGNEKGFTYPLPKYFELLEYDWTTVPESFNKNGVAVITALVSAVEKGYDWAKKHQDEMVKLRLDGKNEEADDLAQQFWAIFKYSIQINAASKNGNLWSGLPVPVNPKVKAKVITECRKLCDLMRETAHITKDGVVSALKQKNRPKFNPVYFWTEVHLFGQDCLSHLASAVIK